MRRTSAFASVLATSWLAFAIPDMAAAEEFRPIESLDRFVSLTNGRDLRRFGIRVQVTPEGQIEGRAFGGPVTGAWTWGKRLFSAAISSGTATTSATTASWLEENGDTLRFTTDRGAGIYADLTLR